MNVYELIYLKAVIVSTACCTSYQPDNRCCMLYHVVLLLSISGHREPIDNLLNAHHNLSVEVTSFYTPPSVLYKR